MVRIFPLHLHISIIQRSRGNSARRRIDYQMCQDHHSDEGSVLAYGNKRREHCGTAILGPSHACHVFPSPSAFRRAHMAAEKRGDAQEGVAIDFCLPREIPDNLRLEAAAFALAPLVEAGMVGQIDIHRARATDGGGNPHAHVLFSQRKVTPQGFGSKERSWEKLFRRDNSRWLRTLIASRLNRYCAAKAIDAAVDPRSNKARGTVSRSRGFRGGIGLNTGEGRQLRGLRN